MAFVVNPKREVIFHHVVENGSKERVEFSVTFKFVASEDIDYSELRKKLAIGGEIEIKNPNTKQITKMDSGSYNAFIYSLRKSLIDCTNIKDPDGNDLIISTKDESGNIVEINEANQIAVFEACRMQRDLFDKIILAYVGHKEKNL